MLAEVPLEWKFKVVLAKKIFRKKTYNAQTIKGNQAERNYCLSGSLVTYQCGEAVVSGKGEMPEP